jgi:ABC-2 type transport system ATP-binding protein
MAVIEVSQLRKTYGDKIAVDDVSFTVEDGEIFGILGPNGAGKTTTVECIEGLRRRDGGDISVLGLDPQQAQRALTKVVGVQLQESALQDKLRVGEAMQLFASFYEDAADASELLRELGIADVVNTPYRRLSGGQKQRLSIALALLGRPRVAVLDELTTGLDPAGRRETWSLIERIRDRGVTVLLVTHFMEEAERLCDRVAIIDDGRVVALDTPARIAAGTGTGQVLRFRLTTPFDPDELRLLSDVTDVRTRPVAGDTTGYVVTGAATMAQTVLSLLSRYDAVAADVQLDHSNLDDAFLALTAPGAASTTDRSTS